ncbi:MAG: glycosyltransferase family protein [Acidimicrobiales bacterium]
MSAWQRGGLVADVVGAPLVHGDEGRRKRTLPRMLWGAVVPGVIYFSFFCLYTWPWVAHPTTRFFTDRGDGYQNVWNMWWVNRAITQLHQLPWQTDLLHFPYGTTLLGQTMNPFNGLVGIVLLRFVPLVVAFNVMVVFSFVATGVTAFWLCWFFCRSYVPSLIGGFVMTFSAYHLSKTLGLMQLVSLEWVPLFVLLWWRLLIRPRVRLAAGTAVTLLLVLLCDYYYFLFCVLSGLAILVYLWRKGELRLEARSSAVFILMAGLLTVPLPGALVLSNLSDTMQGGHASQGTDLFSLVLDGGHWRFSKLTEWYWGAIHAGLADATVYLSLTVTSLLGVAVAIRRRLGPDGRFWLIFAGVAAVFSLGPDLVIHGSDTGIPMPFDLLRAAIPLLEYNVEPARIMVLTTLAASVLVALVLSQLDLLARRGALVTGIVCVGLVVELWPAPPPLTPVGRPRYVTALKNLPPGAVIDDAAVAHGRVDKSLQLYDQVLDDKPLAFGYISRTPDTVAAADARLQAAITGHDYAVLCHHYGFRYFTTPATKPLPGALPVLYNDGRAIIYRLC